MSYKELLAEYRAAITQALSMPYNEVAFNRVRVLKNELKEMQKSVRVLNTPTGNYTN